jgi:hypothetical protein
VEGDRRAASAHEPDGEPRERVKRAVWLRSGLAFAGAAVAAGGIAASAALAIDRVNLFALEPALAYGLLAAAFLAVAAGGALLAGPFVRGGEIDRLARAGATVPLLVATLAVAASTACFVPFPPTRERTVALGVLGALAALLATPLLAPSRRGAAVVARVATSRATRVAGLIGWCVLATLAGAELLVRVADPLLTPKGGFVGTQRRFRLQPHHPIRGSLGHANAYGYNDTDWAEKKPAGSYRIAALGDSFAYGSVGYDDNFLTLLEQRLRERRTGLEVLNLGIPAAEPGDYLEVLRSDGLRFDPDFVLVCVFVGNDFAAPASRTRFVVGGMLAEADPPTWNPLHRVVDVEHWHLYHLFRTRWVGRSAVRAAPTDAEPLVSGTFTREAYRKIQAKRLKYFLRGSRALDLGIARAIENLEAMRAEARARHVPFVIALLPDECQVDPLALRESLDAAGANADQVDLDRPQRLMSAWAGAHGIPLIDLLPPLRVAGAREPIYLVRNSHWNEAGNRVVARLLAEALAPLLG